MSSFLSETYEKPKLVQNRIVKKIVDFQNNKITWEQQFFYQVINYIKINYKIILIFLILFFGLYWRYYETKQQKKYYKTKEQKKYNKNSESESQSDSNTDIDDDDIESDTDSE